MATVDCLVDYNMGSAINTTSKPNTDGGKKNKVEEEPSFNNKVGWKGTIKGTAEAKLVETTINHVQ